MLRKSLLTVVLLFLSTLVSCGGGGGGGSSAGAPKTWTILVYMDGDNNLNEAALADIAEMQAAGPSAYVNIIVQLDLRGGITTKRYRILKGSRELISDLGELDMATPQTIKDFLIWAKDSFPADRTVLVLWDHGNGWDQGDGPVPRTKLPRSMSILYDEDNKSRFLSNHEVAKAIKDSGIKLDMLGLDASIMGTIEALYEFRDLAPVIISSQEVGQESGWDYTTVLSGLDSDPAMSVENLSKIVVSSYKAYLENIFYPSNPGYDKLHSISAMRTKDISLLGPEVDRLALRLISLLDDPLTKAETLALIADARGKVQNIDLYVQPYVYVDLVDLDRLLDQNTEINRLMSEAVISEYHGSGRPKAHGMSVVFFRLPEARNLTYDSNYKNYDPATKTGNGGDFITEFHWDEFLAKYYSYAGL